MMAMKKKFTARSGGVSASFKEAREDALSLNCHTGMRARTTSQR